VDNDDSEEDDSGPGFDAGISEIRSAPDYGLDEGVVEVHYSVSNSGPESHFDIEFDLVGHL